MIKKYIKKYPNLWETIKFIIFIAIVFLLVGCENTYKANKNYVYTFSCYVYTDDYGRKQYGAHQFILDEKIKNMSLFKECYVNYLNWSGLDKDGHYKRAFYEDRKNVRIELFDETWGNVTVTDSDLCN